MRTQNVLLLGEGDYSFCHDLCKVFAADEEAALSFHVIATSFDQRHELLEKYSAVEKVLTTITSNGRATVAYGIDATKDLKAQLIATFCETTTFDHIIFNFPHLGYENLTSHSSLIAHVLYRANQILADCPPDATFYISLAQSQAENWKLEEMAIRNGMVCFDEIPFTQQLWPTYQLKRHHTGKSFGSRVQNSFHYCFRRKLHINQIVDNDIVAAEKEPNTVNLFKLMYSNLVKRFSAEHSSVLKEAENFPEASEIPSAHTALFKSSKNESVCKSVREISSIKFITKTKDLRKKRKVDNMVEGGYRKVQNDVLDSSRANEGVLFADIWWCCNTCEKVFKSEQGVKTHVYMIHILNDGKITKNENEINVERGNGGDCDSKNESINENVDTSLKCEFCDKVSRNADALRQHTLAKHSGKFQNIKPYWAGICTVPLSVITPFIVNIDENVEPVNVTSDDIIDVDFTSKQSDNIDISSTDQAFPHLTEDSKLKKEKDDVGDSNCEEKRDDITDVGKAVKKLEHDDVSQEDNNSKLDKENNEVIECSICGILVNSKEELSNHLLGWQPIVSNTKLNCEFCSKVFKDSRALMQHTNTCLIRF